VRVSRVLVAAGMTLRELSRGRLALGLAAAVPLLFFVVAALVSSHRDVAVQLAAAPTESLLNVDERAQSFVFLAVAAAAVIGAFMAASLVQRRVGASRRLVLCGYAAAELIAAKLLVLLGIVAATAAYTGAVVLAVVRPARPGGVLLGLALGCLVYGGYGLLTGTLLRRDLETIFALLMLINVDAGWLQNPLYYAGSRSRWLIEWLPGHYPAQTSFLAAFTDDPLHWAALSATGYGAVLILLAFVIYSLRMRVRQ
jgi:hypothetical protein